MTADGAVRWARTLAGAVGTARSRRSCETKGRSVGSGSAARSRTSSTAATGQAEASGEGRADGDQRLRAGPGGVTACRSCSSSWPAGRASGCSRTSFATTPPWSRASTRASHTVAVTKTTLAVPYTLSGDYVYSSGARVAGTNGGTFTGVNSHDLEVTLRQFNLDGTPAARPVQQPKASLLKAG